MDAKARKRAKERQDKQRKNETRKRELVESSILKYDATELKTRCSLVERGENLSFINDLKKVLSFTKNGVGLSANQIGVTKKVFVMRPNVQLKDMKVFINAEILSTFGNIVLMDEGCLSYPNFYVPVERHEKIKVKYLDENFTEKIETFVNFEARIIQHEYDHTNFGKCIVGDEWNKQKSS